MNTPMPLWTLANEDGGKVVWMLPRDGNSAAFRRCKRHGDRDVVSGRVERIVTHAMFTGRHIYVCGPCMLVLVCDNHFT